MRRTNGPPPLIYACASSIRRIARSIKQSYGITAAQHWSRYFRPKWIIGLLSDPMTGRYDRFCANLPYGPTYRGRICEHTGVERDRILQISG